MVDPAPKTVPTTVLGNQDQTPSPLPDDLDKDQAKDGTRPSLWTALQAKDRVKSKELTDAEKKLLAGLTVADRANGWQSVYIAGQTDALLHISPDNSVSVNGHAPVGSDKQIDALLKGAVVAKSVNGDIALNVWGGDEKTRLIMCKCSELAGITVKNPPTQTLDQTDPALAKQVEARWKLMNGQAPQTTANLDPTSTAGLVTTPSSLDNAPAVDRHFAGAVTPPVVAGVTPTPTPVVVPKQALT